MNIFKVVAINSITAAKVETVLNETVADGWELVGITDSRAVFARVAVPSAVSAPALTAESGEPK